jgi:RNA recognition motif-containing protein
MRNKLFIGNLPWHITTEFLVAFLQGRGYAFHSAKVVVDGETGRSRGFAFVSFETPEGATQAIADLNGHVLDGRSLLVAVARERNSRHGSDGGEERIRGSSQGRETAGDDGDEGYQE